MRRRLLHAAEIEQGLRRALTDGELRLHYQPIVDLSTRRRSSPSRRSCAGSTPTTACSRPRSSSPPPRRRASPCRSARRSCRSPAASSRAGRVLGARRPPAPAVHVNISARHFAAPGLAGTVSRALRRSGLRARPARARDRRDDVHGRGPARAGAARRPARRRRPDRAGPLRHRLLVAGGDPPAPVRRAEGRLVVSHGARRGRQRATRGSSRR